MMPISYNFQEKFKSILTYLFGTQSNLDLASESVPPLFVTDYTVIPAYHHVYITNHDFLTPQ